MRKIFFSRLILTLMLHYRRKLLTCVRRMVSAIPFKSFIASSLVVHTLYHALFCAINLLFRYFVPS